jgi:hypothetical protein
MQSIEVLKKITVAVQAGDTAGAMNLQPARPQWVFIFGIGTGGLTPFEYLLAGQPVQTPLKFQVAAAELQPFFEHLAPLAADLFHGRPRVYFTAQVTQTEAPDPREIVRALAQTAGHGGGGCDCGCGCG